MYNCDYPPNSPAKAARLAKKIQYEAEHKRIFNAQYIQWITDYVINLRESRQVDRHVAKMRANSHGR